MKLSAIASTPPAADTAPAAGPAAASGPSMPEPREAASQDAPADPQALQEVANRLTLAIGTVGQQVQFSVDHDTGKTVLRVTDVESGAVLRQIPGDEALALARILDRMQGVLIRQKA